MNNKFQFIGRIAKDLELRTTSNGKNVLEVNMAVKVNKEETLFVTPTLFGTQAETLSKYCNKGDLVLISGLIKNHNWEDKNKVKHYDYQFIGTEMFMLSKKKQDSTQENIQVPTNTKTEYQEKEIVIDDKDLPF